MKDMSKVFFNINGYSLKNLTEFNWNKPTEEWTQDNEDIYNQHENVYAGSNKLVFTLTVRTGTDDDAFLKNLEILKSEYIGTMQDGRGKRKHTVPFEMAVVMNNDRNYNRSANTVQYKILASRVAEVMI